MALGRRASPRILSVLNDGPVDFPVVYLPPSLSVHCQRNQTKPLAPPRWPPFRPNKNPCSPKSRWGEGGYVIPHVNTPRRASSAPRGTGRTCPRAGGFVGASARSKEV